MNKNVTRKKWGPPADKFWRHVDKSGNCWNWEGSKFAVNGITRGYWCWIGQLWRAHRMAWRLTYGPIPRGKLVLHRCGNPLCCNPSRQHLYLGRQRDNVMDMIRRGRQFKKLSDEQVLEIRKLARKGISQKDIAARFNASQPHVSAIVRRKARKYVKARSQRASSSQRGHVKKS